VSQYPITGGIYPWARRLWGRRYSWMVAWIYICALVVVITSLVEFAVPFIGNLFGFTPGRGSGLLVAVSLIAVALVLNISGTRTLSVVARLGFFAEIIGVVGLGLYLLIFERHNSFGVFFDAMGAPSTGSYAGGFIAAALIGLYLYYGFEACGDVAEEVVSPERKIPWAMIYTIVLGGVSATAAFMGYTLAAPDLQQIVDGQVADPVTAIIANSIGPIGTKAFLVVALTAFLSCTLSLQAALSRLLFAFGRDKMLPGHAYLAKLSATESVPRNALITASVAPAIVCLWVYFQPDSLVRVTSFAVLGIYLCFQMVVLAALRQRFLGWRPAGPWNLGRFGFIVNILALAYGVAAMFILARPGDASLDFLDRWVVVLGLVLVLASGLLYMVIAKPYRHSDAPAGDALTVAAELRRRASEDLRPHDPVVG
jgi:amino acid transporter